MNDRKPHSEHERKRVAIAAARLIAEEGLGDYALAKRKAAQALGLPESTVLPENTAVEEELRRYQRLFQADEQKSRIDRLRRKACRVMIRLQRFSPYLTGSALDGTAARYAPIDLQLFADSAKDVEIFLLDQKIDFRHVPPRTERAEAVLSLDVEGDTVNLVVYPALEERTAFKTRDGKTKPRARLAAVEKLLLTTDSGVQES